MKKIVSVSIIFLSLAFGCTKKAEQRVTKTLRIALSSEVSTLDPVNSYDNVSGLVIYNIYEQLYEYHYLNRPYELRPLLAESQPLMENQGKRYVIKLKKNIRYHDHPAFKGKVRFVKAEDYITQIKRLSYTPLNSTGWWIIDGVILGVNEFKKTVGSDFSKFKTTAIKGVSAPDDYTLIFDLTQASPQFVYKLAMSFISPIPLEVIEYEKNDLSLHPVGTGPFYLTKIDPAKELILNKFNQYHESFYPSEGDRYANSRGLLKDSGEKIPFVDSINFKIVKDNNNRYDLFIKNELDFIVLPQEFYSQVFDDVGNLKEKIKATDIRLQTMPTLTYWWLAFNMRDPLVGKNLNLRAAIAHAIDMNKYIQLFTNNTGQKANSILPPGIFGYDPSATLPYEYNREVAKDLLAKAGYPNGKNMPELVYDTRAESKISNDQAEFFKEQLSQIGIKVKIVKNNFKQYLEKSRTGRLQFFQDGWTLDYPDAENVLQLLVSTNYPPGPNASFYTNKAFNKMYDRLVILPDGIEKKKIITNMEKEVNRDIPWIMQYYSRNFILYHDYVKNYRPSDLVWSYPKYLRVK
ncbi:MAG: ABC transporter substrate-binding protein [Bacteriovorax sp.]|nr:ABC transporter substrate-binding protein [Bacteriovorax sp.]